MSNNPKNPADDVPRYPGINPRPRTRPGTVAPPSKQADVDLQPATPMPKTVRVMINGKEKRRATGPHAEGWCKAPVKNQFQDGNKGGPGRPRGGKSQDTLLKAELSARQSVKVGGRNRNVAKRELIAKLLVNGALEKRDHRQLTQVNAEARRLWPEQIVEPGAHEAYNPAADRQTLQQLLAQLSLGEPIKGADPFADAAIGGPELGEAGSGDAWEEGDWDAVDEEGSDDDR